MVALLHIIHCYAGRILMRGDNITLIMQADLASWSTSTIVLFKLTCMIYVCGGNFVRHDWALACARFLARTRAVSCHNAVIDFFLEPMVCAQLIENTLNLASSPGLPVHAPKKSHDQFYQAVTSQMLGGGGHFSICQFNFLEHSSGHFCLPTKRPSAGGVLITMHVPPLKGTN